MLGAIIGDTIGSVYEFFNTKDYNFNLFEGSSCYTDDSILTMAVAHWLLTDRLQTYQDLEDSLVMFAHNTPCPMGGFGEAFYRWAFCPQEMEVFDEQYGKSPYKSKTGRHPYGSWGNGSAMRVSAVGWFCKTLQDTEWTAKKSAEITHNHPDGIIGARATAASIWLARKGYTKDQIRYYVENACGYPLNYTWEELNRGYYWHSSCQGTVPPAIACFLESDSFEDAIRKAVSIGGDSDTLACITGGIAEAYYKEIPKWIVDKTVRCFPPVFNKVLEALRKNTEYGSTVRIKE